MIINIFTMTEFVKDNRDYIYIYRYSGNAAKAVGEDETRKVKKLKNVYQLCRRVRVWRTDDDKSHEREEDKNRRVIVQAEPIWQSDKERGKLWTNNEEIYKEGKRCKNKHAVEQVHI